MPAASLLWVSRRPGWQIRLSKAQSRLTCQWRQPSVSYISTYKPPQPSASTSRMRSCARQIGSYVDIAAEVGKKQCYETQSATSICTHTSCKLSHADRPAVDGLWR